ncbi:MAG TPA: hypothetical protein VEK38_01355 [Candidatus Bathyarchaeia archaeon]|nr:hypothetical protein [Candidatus Bathyarchaeia archaeon]
MKSRNIYIFLFALHSLMVVGNVQTGELGFTTNRYTRNYQKKRAALCEYHKKSTLSKEGARPYYIDRAREMVNLMKKVVNEKRKENGKKPLHLSRLNGLAKWYDYSKKGLSFLLGKYYAEIGTKKEKINETIQYEDLLKTVYSILEKEKKRKAVEDEKVDAAAKVLIDLKNQIFSPLGNNANKRKRKNVGTDKGSRKKRSKLSFNK